MNISKIIFEEKDFEIIAIKKYNYKVLNKIYFTFIEPKRYKRYFSYWEVRAKGQNDNFGQVSTDLSSSESVANMLAYILGEEILFNNNTYNLFTKFHNEYLSKDKRDLLVSSLKGELNNV